MWKRVLYPLEIEITPKGIVNYEGLKEQWLKERKSIQQSYSGKEVALLLENMDKIINNVIDLTALLLKRDWFFSVFFAPVYRATLNKTQSCTFPFIPYTPPIPFVINREIKKHPIKINDVVITVTGKCKDTRSEHDILRGNLISLDKNGALVKGEVDLKFQVYEGSSIADAVTGFCLLEFLSGKNKRMSIEIYNLKNEIPNSRKGVLKEVQNKEKEMVFF